MTNTQVTKPAANSMGLQALQSLRSGLMTVRQQIPTSVGGTPLLRMGKDGQWMVGREDTTIPHGTEALVNPLALQHGYSCWTNRKPGQGKNELMGQEMWSIREPKAPVSTLPQHHDARTQDLCEWKDAMSVELRFIDGPMPGQQVLFNTTSVGGLRMMDNLLGEIMDKIDTGSEYVFPWIQLGADSYQHSQYGKTYIPLFTIVTWADMQGNEEPSGDQVPLAKAAAPAPQPASAPAPQPEPAQAAAAVAADASPVGRRRRV